MSNNIKFCTNCLYPSNHPLLLSFLENGLCMGCHTHYEKDEMDWDKKKVELIRLVEQYRSKTNYDCIVPVCGGKDSFYVVHIVKKVLNLNPLLVSYNRIYNTAIGIKNLENLRTRFGCDILTLTPEESLVKELTLETLRLFGSIHWPYLAGSTVFPVQMAVKMKIPLIIWGAHQGLDQVGMFSHHDEVEMTRRYRKEHDLMGFEAENLVNKSSILTEKKLEHYFYPSDESLRKVGVRGIYLNNYLRWDSKAQHEKMIELYGYLTTNQNRTFDSYNDVHCSIYSDIHDYIKFCKFGFGKATDHACREIRLGRLTREEAGAIVNEYQERKLNNMHKFLSWLNCDEMLFNEYVNAHRDIRVWKKQFNGAWEKISSEPTSCKTMDTNSLLSEKCKFTISNDQSCDIPESKEYPLLMRGWSEETKATQKRTGIYNLSVLDKVL